MQPITVCHAACTLLLPACSLLLPKAEVLAARLKAAMEGWGNDGSALVRILAGIDGAQLAATSAAYLTKYQVPHAQHNYAPSPSAHPLHAHAHVRSGPPN